MQPDPTHLLEIIGPDIPLVGFYDAPDPAPFSPLVRPAPGQRTCIFAFYRNWLAGETLHITRENFGCGGAGRALCGVETRSRDDFVRFLADDEGLKASHELMNQWLDYRRPYEQAYPHILIGPLCPDQYAYLKAVTFYVNPDRCSILALGAQYHSAPDDPSPVLAPFGSGCAQLVSLFDDLRIPQAVIVRLTLPCASTYPPTFWRLRRQSRCLNSFVPWTREAFSINHSGSGSGKREKKYSRP
jgi:hypothetical protein